MWGFLEDFGYVLTRKKFRPFDYMEENRRVFLQAVRGLKEDEMGFAVEVSVVSELPDKFSFLFERAVLSNPSDNVAASTYV